MARSNPQARRTNARTSKHILTLVAQLKPHLRIGHTTIICVTKCQAESTVKQYRVTARCDCGNVTTSDARQYVDALDYNRDVWCRSCKARRIGELRWTTRRKNAKIDPWIEKLARALLSRHRQAAARLGIGDNEGAEIQWDWREIVPEVMGLLQAAREDQRKQSHAA